MLKAWSGDAMCCQELSDAAAVLHAPPPLFNDGSTGCPMMNLLSAAAACDESESSRSTCLAAQASSLELCRYARAAQLSE